MKALRQLGFLKLSLRPPDVPLEEDHRVLALFRNRAELKKAYGDLQEETFRLKDLVKQQEGATQRVQEMLNALEGRLGVAETAYPALVFYQLRHLWQSGREMLTAFVADLARQQEERERRAHLAQHNREQFARRQGAEAALNAAQALQAESTAQLATLEGERAALTRFWHYFRRRALERRIGAAQVALAGINASVAEAQAQVDEIARESAAEFPGLSLQSRRSINLAVIACAEVLCLRLTELKTPLVELARQAIGRREPGNEYGTPKECVLLMGEIARAHRLIAEREGLGAEIRERGERLKSVARYRGPKDSAPQVECLAPSEGDVLALPAQGGKAARLPNVLAEDTWDLFRVLLR
jgi:hypothetical protein